MGQGGQWPLKLDCRTCIEPQDNHTLAGKESAAIGTTEIRLGRQSDATGTLVVHESSATKECETGDGPLPRQSETRYIHVCTRRQSDTPEPVHLDCVCATARRLQASIVKATRSHRVDRLRSRGAW